jgi:bacillithiol synthase
MSFHKTTIPLASSGQFSKLMLHYTEAHDGLKDLYECAPSVEECEKIISKLSEKTFDRALLTNAIKEQYLRAGINNITHIEILNDPKTYTVCTGHQLCLFAGPLYFIYKIISTINLAETLKKQYPDYNFVPVYWMASEDHDFDEVKSIHLFGKTITWNNMEAKGAVGMLSTEGIKPVLDELFEIIGDSENAVVLKELFTKAYLQHNTLADATRYLVNELFKNYSLIIVDGNDVMLKKQAKSIISNDLFTQTNYKQVSATIENLNAKGYKVQVNPREINCFYIKDKLRERIVFNENTGMYEVLNTNVSFTEQQLKEELENNTHHFSPNVVLRPLYQQTVLPNIAYIGGPGEIAYWLQYKAMFDANNVVYPMLVPRHFAMLLDTKHVQLIHKLGFEPADIFKDIDTLTKEYLASITDNSLSVDAEEKAILEIFNNLNQRAGAVDASLKAFVEAETQKVLKSLKAIEAKMLRSEKHKQETSIQQLTKIEEKYFPQQSMQERYDNFIPYYLKYGTDYIPNLKEVFVSFEFELLLLS